MNFALYKGSEGSQVLITAKPPGTTAIDAVEKETGEGKRLAKGVCFYENDTLVFTTKTTPAPSWEATITKAFKDHHCGAFLPITVRQMGANESEEVVTEEGDEPAAPASGGPAAPAGPVAPPPPAGTAAPADAPAPPPAPPAPAPPAPSAAPLSADAAEDYCEKLKAALTPKINAAITANPAAKAELLPLLKAAVDHEKAGRFPAAIASFKELAAAVKEAAPAAPASGGAPPAPSSEVPPAPPVSGGPAPAAPAPAQPAAPGPMPAEVSGAINRVAPDVKKIVAANPEVKNSLLHQVAAVQEAIKAGDPVEAAAAAEALEARVARLNALAAEGPAPTAEQNAAALEGALKKYSDARGTVVASLKSLEDGIRGLNDPDGDAAIILVKSIQAQLTARPESLQQVAELERYLTTDDVIADAESPNDLGVTVVIRDTLLPTLASLREVLEAA